jgi:hypothetical protein
MGRIAAYLLIGIGVGLGFAYWQGAGQFGSGPEAGVNSEALPLERRLSELETSLALERFERQALADELADLREVLALVPEFSAGLPPESADRPGGTGDGDREVVEERIRQRFPDGVPQTVEEREQYLRQRQVDNLIEAGLPPDRARYILQRQEALEMEALQGRYEATQNGASPEEVASLSPDSLLRAELGDAEYEKYLQGTGRPTTISVRDVLPNSPAQAVGLQPGDEILAYNGKRVFDIGELNQLTNALKPGQTVALQLERDGQRLQVYVQSGPIGISGGGRSTRRSAPGVR